MTKRNVDWGRVHGEPAPHSTRNPGHKSTGKRDRCALWDLYHNPDPLVHLIGEPNETAVIVENVQVKGLVDLGAQI